MGSSFSLCDYDERVLSDEPLTADEQAAFMCGLRAGLGATEKLDKHLRRVQHRAVLRISRPGGCLASR